MAGRVKDVQKLANEDIFVVDTVGMWFIVIPYFSQYFTPPINHPFSLYVNIPF